MREIFADTFYWTALADPSDEWHRRATELDSPFEAETRLVTTDEVLSEFATHLGSRDQRLRRIAARYVRALLNSPGVRVIPQSRASFLAGLELFENRLDKGYSFTDCISMAAMRHEGLTEALTRDHHFAQEGFVTLFP